MSWFSVGVASALAGIHTLFSHPATAIPAAVKDIEQAQAGIDTLNAFAGLLPNSPNTAKLKEAIGAVDALAAKAVVEVHMAAPVVESVVGGSTSAPVEDAPPPPTPQTPQTPPVPDIIAVPGSSIAG